jgi:hypothetical protein
MTNYNPRRNRENSGCSCSCSPGCFVALLAVAVLWSCCGSTTNPHQGDKRLDSRPQYSVTVTNPSYSAQNGR